jgi:hypothetical protein
MEKPDVIRISEELEAMPETAKVDRVRIHAMNFFIFTRNTVELRNALNFHSNVKENFSWWDVDNRENLYGLQREIGRLLHNFVAAASSLIDTTRRLSEQYKEDQFPDYQAKINSEFVNDPLAQFVVKLRQYSLHYQAPPIVSRTEFNAEQHASIATQICLPSRILLQFSGWNKHAKDYIALSGDYVVLEKVVDDYYQKIVNFYNWFYTRLTEIHESDLTRLASKRQELKSAYYVNALAYLRMHLNEYHRGNETPNTILSHVLSPDDKPKIMAITDPQARADAAIKTFSKYVDLPSNLIEEIKKVFANHKW